MYSVKSDCKPGNLFKKELWHVISHTNCELIYHLPFRLKLLQMNVKLSRIVVRYPNSCPERNKACIDLSFILIATVSLHHGFYIKHTAVVYVLSQS